MEGNPLRKHVENDTAELELDVVAYREKPWPFSVDEDSQSGYRHQQPSDTFSLTKQGGLERTERRAGSHFMIHFKRTPCSCSS